MPSATDRSARSGTRSFVPLLATLGAGALLFTVHATFEARQSSSIWADQLSEYARQGAGLLAAVTIEGRSATDTQGLGAFHPWAGTLLASDNIEFVACLNNDGKLVAALPAGDEIAPRIKQIGENLIPQDETNAVMNRADHSVGMAAIPGFPSGTTLGYVVIGGVKRPGPVSAGMFDSPAAQGAIFMACSLLVGLLGVLFSARSRSSALRGLVPREDQSPRVWRASLPTRRQDDVGEIARVLDRLYSDLDTSRADLATLKQTMDARVADRTRQVNGMLLRAEEKAWKDPLTRLGNRRLLEERLESIFEAQEAAKDDFSIVMMDLDYFKTLNDSCGHAAGDELLSFLGDLLRGTLRPSDIGIRYGGDEFCLLLLGVNSEQASQAAERIGRLFAQHAATLPTNPKPSLSMGVASLADTKCQSGSELLSKADAALYSAKRGGRNRVHRSGTFVDNRSSELLVAR